MRTIKFRGREYYTDEWVFGFLSEDDEGLVISNYDKEADIIRCHAVVENTVGQYTGLKDKNGTEIYEGDKLKHYPGFGCEWSSRQSIIEWKFASFWANSGSFQFILDDHDQQLEIIGNIHEK